MRFRTAFIIAFSFLFLLTGCGQKTWQGDYAKPGQNEILWDSYGVPHIYSESEEGAFYGFGWAQAHSHGNLILRLYGQARGKGAEYWAKNTAKLISGLSKMTFLSEPSNGMKRKRRNFVKTLGRPGKFGSVQTMS